MGDLAAMSLSSPEKQSEALFWFGISGQNAPPPPQAKNQSVIYFKCTHVKLSVYSNLEGYTPGVVEDVSWMAVSKSEEGSSAVLSGAGGLRSEPCETADDASEQSLVEETGNNK